MHVDSRSIYSLLLGSSALLLYQQAKIRKGKQRYVMSSESESDSGADGQAAKPNKTEEGDEATKGNSDIEPLAMMAARVLQGSYVEEKKVIRSEETEKLEAKIAKLEAQTQNQISRREEDLAQRYSQSLFHMGVAGAGDTFCNKCNEFYTQLDERMDYCSSGASCLALGQCTLCLQEAEGKHAAFENTCTCPNCPITCKKCFLCGGKYCYPCMDAHILSCEKRVRAIIVTGAGSDEVNGTYELHDCYIGDAPTFRRKGIYKGRDVEFCIMRVREGRLCSFCISIPDEDNPGTDLDRDFYKRSAKVGANKIHVPPPTGWRIFRIRGFQPIPSFEYVLGDA